MFSGCFAFDFRLGVAGLFVMLCFRSVLRWVYCCLFDLLFGVYLDASTRIVGFFVFM